LGYRLVLVLEALWRAESGHPALRQAGAELAQLSARHALSQKLLPASSGLESVIQDVDVPIARGAEFREFLLREIGISPVWVCPFRTSDRTYDLCPLKPNQLYVNFGFWDMVPPRTRMDTTTG
jgi:hypothetical protein